MGAAEASHYFLSVTKFGHSAIVSTKGNEDCHIIYVVGIKVLTIKAEDVAKVCAEIEKSGRIPHVMVDFSHAIVANNSKTMEFVKIFASKLQVVQRRSSVSW